MVGGKIYTEIRQKNKKTKNKLLYLLFRLGFWRAGFAGAGLAREVGGNGLGLGGD